MSYEILLAGCATLDMMLEGERPRRVRASCTKCQNYRDVDLLALRALVGGDYSLVNRRCRCRLKKRCNGWNRFYVLHGTFVPLWDDRTAMRWSALDWQRQKRQWHAE
jgi:hypothetical protein